jgi:uncharacterized protein YcbX
VTVREDQQQGFRVVRVTRFPVKSMGGELLDETEVDTSGLVGDREWAVYDARGKLASGKHSRRFRRMDPVFALVAERQGERTLVRLPHGAVVLADRPEADSVLSAHFGEPVWLRREGEVPHQDAAEVSIVGTATLAELGRHDGDDGAAINPRHVRANLVVETAQPYAEESWCGRVLTIGTATVRVTEPTERCRMVGVGQVGLPARPGLLRAIADHHRLVAGVYATVVRPGRIRVGDHAHLG